jgi:hypothetical protein
MGREAELIEISGLVHKSLSTMLITTLPKPTLCQFEHIKFSIIFAVMEQI